MHGKQHPYNQQVTFRLQYYKKRFSWVFGIIAILSALLPIIGVLISLILPNHHFTADAFLFIPPILLIYAYIFSSIVFLIVRPRRISVVIAIALFAVMQSLLGFEYRLPDNKAIKTEHINVITWNCGQNKGYSLDSTIKRKKVNMVLLQGGTQHNSKLLEDRDFWRSHHREGEYRVFTNHELLEIEKLTALGKVPYHYGMRYLLKIREGQTLAVYNIHLPTFKDPILAIRSALFAFDIKGCFSALNELGKIWQIHHDCSLALMRKIRSETETFLVGGDFNSTPHTWIHRNLAQYSTDSHDGLGYGYGWTIPGRNNQALILPDSIYRIDYIFASKELELHKQSVLKAPLAQHRPVFCSLSF